MIKNISTFKTSIIPDFNIYFKKYLKWSLKFTFSSASVAPATTIKCGLVFTFVKEVQVPDIAGSSLSRELNKVIIYYTPLNFL